MPLTKQQIAQKAKNLFTYFEAHYFENSLSYSRRINLVLEFCDYVNNLKDWEIMDVLESEKIQDADAFRQMINNDADVWLGDLIKTISY